MNTNSLLDYLPWINQQTASQEALLEYLFKAEAMLTVILLSDPANYSRVTLYDYLWGLSDLIEQARVLNEDLLNALLKVTVLVKAASEEEPPTEGSTFH